MTPDDARHGTVAGYIAHQRHDHNYCQPCTKAKAMYDKRRVWEAANGRGYTVPSLGARRRIQALRAIGWSRPRIAQEAGWTSSGSLRYIDRSDTITRTTHDRIAEAYERICMKRPPDEMAAIRTRTWARKAGYAPPLAWDNIDDPDEWPKGHAEGDAFDGTVVDRILSGDWRLAANRAERYAVLDRWAGTQNELERLTGWNVSRLLREAA